jgi:hypothetical protein
MLVSRCGTNDPLVSLASPLPYSQQQSQYPLVKLCVPESCAWNETWDLEVACQGLSNQVQHLVWSTVACVETDDDSWLELTQRTCVSIHVGYRILEDGWLFSPWVQAATGAALIRANTSVFQSLEVRRIYNESLYWYFLPLDKSSACGPRTWSVDWTPDELIQCRPVTPDNALDWWDWTRVVDTVTPNVAVIFVFWVIFVSLWLLGHWFGVWLRYPLSATVVHTLFLCLQVPMFVWSDYAVIQWGVVFGVCGAILLMLLRVGVSFHQTGWMFMKFPQNVNLHTASHTGIVIGMLLLYVTIILRPYTARLG